MSSPPRTTYVCPRCQQPTAFVLSEVTAFVLAFRCEGCAFWWVSMHPAYVKPTDKTQK
jgi:hypothetical protein